MRVTDKLIFDRASRDTSRARERAEEAMRAASTGSRVDHPSDDPAAAGMIQAFAMSSARLAAVSRNAGMARSEMEAADGALDGIALALTRARELAVQMSQSGYTASGRAGAAGEIGALLSEVVARANTRFGNRWLFGGTRDGGDPFDAAGSYSGDANVRRVEIAPGVLQDASIRADVALKGVGGGVDVFGVLQQLQAALAANDEAAVRSTLTGLDASLDQVALARSEAGLGIDTFTTAESAAKQASSDEKTRGDKLGEVDLIDSSIQLSLSQRALEASLSAAAQGFKLSLLNYL